MLTALIAYIILQMAAFVPVFIHLYHDLR